MALIHNKKDLIKLCNSVTELLQRYQTSNEIVRKAVLTQNKWMRGIQIAMITLSAFLWTIYISKAIITVDYLFVYETALPDSYVLCAMVLMSQFYFSSIQVMAVLVTNFIYLLLCAFLILLMQALRENLKKIIDSKHKSMMKEDIFYCISDHQTLLS